MKYKTIKNKISAIICSFALIIAMITGNFAGINHITANATVSTSSNFPYHTVEISPFTPIYQSGIYNSWEFVLDALTIYKYNINSSISTLQQMGQNYYDIYGVSAFGTETNGVVPLDVSITPHALGYFTYSYFGNTVTMKNGRIGDLNIVSNILADNPIIVYLTGTNNNLKHVVMITGYLSTDQAADGLSYLKIFDPYDATINYVAAPTNEGTLYYTRSDNASFYWSNTIVINDYPNSVDLSYKYAWQHQQKTNWCWAASACMVLEEVFGSTAMTQNNIVSYVYDSTLPNNTGTVDNIMSYVSFLTNGYTGFINRFNSGNSIKEINTIVSQLQKGHACYIAYSYLHNNVTKRHAVVCIGYTYSPTNGYTLKIYDPAPSTSTVGVYETTSCNCGDNSYTINSNISEINYGTVNILEGFCVEF